MLAENFSKNLIEGNLNFLKSLIPPLFLSLKEDYKVFLNIENIEIILKSIEEVYGMDKREIIENAKELGKSIGYLAAETENKDILYQLRETKTKNSLIKLIRGVLYLGLKHSEEDSKIIGNIKNNEDNIYKVIEMVKEESIDIFMDILSVYALLNYFSGSYVKRSKSKRGEENGEKKEWK